MPDWSKVEVPLFSASNWGGQGLHPRGNFEGFVRSASDQKWLEVHGIEHWTEFYTDYGVALQKKFFGHFLKGTRTQDGQRSPRSNSWFVTRANGSWSATKRTGPYRAPIGPSFTSTPTNRSATSRCRSMGSVTYAGLGDGATFLTQPLATDTEITGPIAAKLWISSETADADLFLIVRVFSPDMKEVTFMGALDPHTPIAQGWLRVSHRKRDEELSLPYRPYHTHDEVQPLTPGEVYEVDVEVWPTCIVVPRGHRIGLTVRGRDYEWPGGGGTGLGTLGAVFSGVGPFKHDDSVDRPAEVFGGDVTLHMGPDRPAHLLLPIVPTTD